MRYLWVLCIAISVMACRGRSTPKSVILVTTVVDEAGRPVDGVRVVADSTSGITDVKGKFAVALPGPEGRIVRVAVECKEGWFPRSGDTIETPIRFVESISSSEVVMAPIKVGFQCIRKMRRVVLLVRTDGHPGLDVKALGKRIAATDVDGVAQTLIEGEPGEEFEVSIDTSKNPSLRPSMPSRRLLIPKNSQILVFDQKFEEKVTKKRVKKKRRKKVMRPRRI